MTTKCRNAHTTTWVNCTEIAKKKADSLVKITRFEPLLFRSDDERPVGERLGGDSDWRRGNTVIW